jgi:4'-phosphopantetheinyl transferase
MRSPIQPMRPWELFNCREEWHPPRGIAHCDVWLVSAAVDAPGRESLENLLSADERARAERFHFEADRARFIAARAGLRRILAYYSSLPPELIEFQIDAYGKPLLLRPSVALEFNVSHAGDYALIAITSGLPCGVDIERCSAKLDEAAVAAKFFCPREAEWLSHAEGGFLRLWAAKEAVVKAMGGGLSIPLCNFDVVDVLEGKSSSVTVSTPSNGCQSLWVSELELAPNYSAAVAVVSGKEDRSCELRITSMSAPALHQAKRIS